MQVSMDAKRNGVAFRRATFRNPLPRMIRGIWNTLQVIGAARAAAELTRMGYGEEAKELMMNLKVNK